MSNPDARGRTEILNLYLQDKPLGEDVDVQVLARGTPGFSGAGTLLFVECFCFLCRTTHIYICACCV